MSFRQIVRLRDGVLALPTVTEFRQLLEYFLELVSRIFFAIKKTFSLDLNNKYTNVDCFQRKLIITASGDYIMLRRMLRMVKAFI